jgi:poly(3-hydroxybutyrate) depolymerase
MATIFAREAERTRSFLGATIRHTVLSERCAHLLALSLCVAACSSNQNDGGPNTGLLGSAGGANPMGTAMASGGGPAAGAPGASGGSTAMSSGGTAPSGKGGTVVTASGGAPPAGMGGTAGMTSSAGAAGMAGTGTAGTGGGGGAGGGGAGGGPSTCTPMGMAGTDPCMSSLKANDDRLCKFSFNGAMRQFYIYASPAFDPCQPASLIMDCHGLSETAEVHIGKAAFSTGGSTWPKGYGSSWRMAVRKDNAIVVTPQGVNNSWSTATDVPFVNKAADMVEAIANVKKDHVYVTGISMGGMMTVATGCDATTGDRWKGMAPVSMLQQGCSKLAGPTPVISFHATGDALTSYSADQTLMGTIAGLNHCKTGPTASVQYGGSMTSMDPVCFVGPNGPGAPDQTDPLNIPLGPCKASVPASKCVKWSDCDGGVEVVFCTVDATGMPLGGHILYNNASQLDLSEVAWPFFKKFWK